MPRTKANNEIAAEEKEIEYNPFRLNGKFYGYNANLINRFKGAWSVIYGKDEQLPGPYYHGEYISKVPVKLSIKFGLMDYPFFAKKVLSVVVHFSLMIYHGSVLTEIGRAAKKGYYGQVIGLSLLLMLLTPLFLLSAVPFAALYAAKYIFSGTIFLAAAPFVALSHGIIKIARFIERGLEKNGLTAAQANGETLSSAASDNQRDLSTSIIQAAMHTTCAATDVYNQPEANLEVPNDAANLSFMSVVGSGRTVPQSASSACGGVFSETQLRV